MMTVKFPVDLDHGLRRGNATVPYLYPVSDVFQLKNIASCRRVLLFCVVLCVVRVMHKFEFRLVTNEKYLRHKVIETRVFDIIYMISPDGRRGH
jgi:hypothetical protein